MPGATGRRACLPFKQSLNVGEFVVNAPLAERIALAWTGALLEIHKIGFLRRAG